MNVDWRNRWGRNWITSVRNQGGSQNCWAFGMTALYEAMIRIEHNLWAWRSEGDLARGTGKQAWDLGNFGEAAIFVDRYGLADPNCFPWGRQPGRTLVAAQCQPERMVPQRRLRFRGTACGGAVAGQLRHQPGTRRGDDRRHLPALLARRCRLASRRRHCLKVLSRNGSGLEVRHSSPLDRLRTDRLSGCPACVASDVRPARRLDSLGAARAGAVLSMKHLVGFGPHAGPSGYCLR
jgi:hypothetical protein